MSQLFDFGLRFDAPHWLLLLPLAWSLLWLAERRGRVRLSESRRRVTRAARWLTVALLIAALAGATAWRREDRLSVVFAVDTSRSMSGSLDAARQWLDEAAAMLPEGDRVGIVVFGAEAMVERYPTEQWEGGELLGRPDPNGTDLAGAVGLARGLFPPGHEARLVLLTDGRSTTSDLEQTLANIPAAVDVVWVPLESTTRPEVLVEQVVAPDRVVEGEPHRVRVVVRSSATTDATLRLYRGAMPISAARVRLEPGRANVFAIEQETPEGGGALLYRAEVEAVGDDADQWTENNRGATIVRVEGRPRVLLVDRDPASLGGLRNALEQSGMGVIVGPVSALPGDPLRLHAFDAVLLADVPATSLSTRLLEQLGGYVQAGGGLLMLGGPDSFGAGGYWRSPLEPVLPVNMDVKDRTDLPSVGLVLCIDKSGSMAGLATAAKIDVAKAAAAEVVRALGPIDRVGVIGFDAAAKWVVELQQVGDTAAVIERLGTLRAGGGTDAYPAMQAAQLALNAAEVRVKHVILLTDGQLQSRDHEGLAERMKQAGITISTIAVGTDADFYTLERIAHVGGGRAYAAQDINRVSRIFLREAFRVSRSWLVEEPFQPKIRSSHPALAGLDLRKAPPLGGYVAASEKPGAQHPLATHRDDPLLSLWHYGVGRSVAFTSDAKARWGARWFDWDGYAPFWSGLVRWTARSTDGAARLQASMAAQEGILSISADVLETDGTFLNGAAVVATLVGPDGDRREVDLRQVGPGQYTADVPQSAPGAWFGAVRVEGGDDADGKPIGGTATAVVPYSREFATLDRGAETLERLADSGRVRRAGDMADLFVHSGTGSQVRWPLMAWLIAAAATSMVVEVGARRLHLGRRRRPVAAVPLERLDRLRAARGRARRRQSEAAAQPARTERSPASTAVSVHENAEGPAPAEPPQPAVAAPPTDTEPHTARLLRARRRRRDRNS